MENTLVIWYSAIPKCDVLSVKTSRKKKICVCDAVTIPFILGIIRSKIYFPSSLLEPNMEYVIAHDQSHLRRKEHWWKPMAFVLLSVFWFDPLMWIAYPSDKRYIQIGLRSESRSQDCNIRHPFCGHICVVTIFLSYQIFFLGRVGDHPKL